MSVEIITQRLLSYQCQNILEQENALKEIAQEIALMALSRVGFFKKAAFQGGTCLRILFGLPRFSEDLDFVLEQPDKKFEWNGYLETMAEEFLTYGYGLEVTQKTKLDRAIQTAFLKADSLGGLLLLKDIRSNRPKIQIKLEIDTNPPQGSGFDLKYLDFPLAYSIRTQDLPSLFASKIHALLCRPYVKGRDWYDFVWYVARQTKVNVALLAAAIDQIGPWRGQQLSVTADWLSHQIREKILQIDWSEAQKDVVRFIRPKELSALELWSSEFFLSRVEKFELTADR